MAELNAKVRQLMQLKRSEVLADLRDTYGKPGPTGWSLTEVLRLDRTLRGRMLDLLMGTVAGKVGIAPGHAGQFRLRTVSGEPVEVPRVRPDPDSEPTVREGGFDGLPTVMHHRPTDWIVQTWTMAPDVALPLYDHHQPTNSASWMLMWHGYGARQGGGEKRRWGDKKIAGAAKRAKRPAPPEALDRWTVYEVAYAERHPDLDLLPRGGQKATERPAARAAA